MALRSTRVAGIAWRVALYTGLAVLAGGPVAHAQWPIPHGTNVLLGRVTEVSTGAGVAGAVVTLTGFFEPTGEAVPGLPPTGQAPLVAAPRSVLTTANGDFVFHELPAGTFALTATAFGYITNSFPRSLVELKASDRPSTVTLRLWKLGAIAGRIVDEHGEPVMGVLVSALHRVILGGTISFEHSVEDVETDDRGMYRIPQVPPGSYVVAAMASSTTLPASFAGEFEKYTASRMPTPLIEAVQRAGWSVGTSGGAGIRIGDLVLQRPGPPPVLSPEGRVLVYGTTLFPGTSNPAEAAVVSLGSGESKAGVDMTLRFAPTAIVAGVLRGPAGPVPYATVRLLPPSAADFWNFEPSGASTAITDARGAFAFAGVSSGSYQLRTIVQEADTGSPAADSSLWAMQPIVVADADVTSLDVVLQPGLRVSGRVDFQGDAIPALPQGRKFLIGLRPVGASIWAPLSGNVGPDGTFSTIPAPPGKYAITTAAPNGWYLLSVSQGSISSDEQIDLGAADLTNVVLRFTKKVIRVSGAIVNASGVPDAEADAVIFPADNTAWRQGFFSSRRIRTAHATTSGNYQLSELLPGEYYIAAVSNRLLLDWQDPMLFERLVPIATRITIGDGDQRTVALRTMVIGR